MKRRKQPRGRSVPSGRTIEDKGYVLLHEAQGKIDEAIGLIATIYRSCQAVQGEEGHATAVDLEDQIAALGIGVNSLRSAYDNLATAIVKVTP